MLPRPRHAPGLLRPLALAAAVFVALLALGGCGGESGSTGYVQRGNTLSGKELFTAKCGSCHVLANAGTGGEVGPNLDDAFRRSREDGMTEDTVRQVVRAQIQYPITQTATGSPGMPGVDDLLPECSNEAGNEPAGCVRDQGQAADDVATYVASVAGVDETPPAGDLGDLTDGEAIFTSTLAGCAGCHTLAKAKAAGTVGPNLDESGTTLAVAIDRITNGRAGMPSFSDRLSEEQIQAVAEYVTADQP